MESHFNDPYRASMATKTSFKKKGLIRSKFSLKKVVVMLGETLEVRGDGSKEVFRPKRKNVKGRKMTRSIKSDKACEANTRNNTFLARLQNLFF